MFPRNLAMLLCPAAGGAATMGGATPATPVYFLFTTIPPHAARLAQIATEMRRQHHRPTGIVLTLPARYHRFNASETAALHEAANEWQSRTSGVRIHNVPTDHGPLLKYFGSRFVDPASALCVVGDDDVTYRPHWLQRFVNASSALPAALRRAVVITGNYAWFWAAQPWRQGRCWGRDVVQHDEHAALAHREAMLPRRRRGRDQGRKRPQAQILVASRLAPRQRHRPAVRADGLLTRRDVGFLAPQGAWLSNESRVRRGAYLQRRKE